MTQKEKAQEIFNKFSLISPLYIEEKRNKSAKQQALLAVATMIDELDFISKNLSGGIPHTIGYGSFDRLEFYRGVKTELENL